VLATTLSFTADQQFGRRCQSSRIKLCCALQAAASASTVHAVASQPVGLAGPADGAAGADTAPPGARQQPGSVVSPAAAPASAQMQARPSVDDPAAALDGLEPEAIKQLLIEVQTLYAFVCIVIVSFGPAHRVALTTGPAACTFLGNAAQQIQRLAQVQACSFVMHCYAADPCRASCEEQRMISLCHWHLQTDAGAGSRRRSHMNVCVPAALH
jgi:hypothetical protein